MRRRFTTRISLVLILLVTGYVIADVAGFIDAGLLPIVLLAAIAWFNSRSARDIGGHADGRDASTEPSRGPVTTKK